MISGIAPPMDDDLARRSQAAVWHPCTQMKHHEHQPPLPIVRGEGVWLVDAAGRRYLDAVSSWWVNLFGHAHPRINAALKAQLDELEHTMLAGFTHRPAVELAERLAALTGLGHAFYASDGASATEIALKMSFHYWRNAGRPEKQRFVALSGGYHGETVGALSVTDVPIFRDAYAPLLRQHVLAPFPGEDADAGQLRALFQRHGDELAALIVEPLVQGAAGMRMYNAGWLRAARALCDEHDVHLIADEIMTGFGRTGTLFACEQAGIRPDLMCLSKGITGGYLPLSCVLASDALYAAFYDDDATRGFLHSHSYTGSALACRAALAVLDIFRDDDVIAANRQRAAAFDRAGDVFFGDARIVNRRRCGMIWAGEVRTAPDDFARRYVAAAQAEGALLRPIGRTVYFMPPYTITEEEFVFLASAARRALDRVVPQ